MIPELNDSGPRDHAKFGGSQFSHQIELCFAGLTDTVGLLLNSKVREFPHPTGLILANLHQTAKAALALAPEELLNEAYLMMRILIDTGVTFAYLLESDDAERKKYLEQPAASQHLASGSAEQLLEQAKSMKGIDSMRGHALKPIRERIDSLADNGVIRREAWLILVASIFPHSSEILAGGIHAHLLPMLKRSGSKQLGSTGDEFTMLYFLAGQFLAEVIGICSKHVEIPSLNDEARSLDANMVKLMNQADEGINDPAQGNWARLDRIEHFGTKRISRHLAEFENAFSFTYEAGYITPTLNKEPQKSEFRLWALYFRRALNDFRAIWILLSKGYTSQASSCAGSLFETSLASICLLNPDKTKEFELHRQSATSNDFPWKPIQMAKLVCATEKGLSDSSPEHQDAWQSLYARYVWLSSIRHSAFQSVLHETGSTTSDCGQYVIMAIPNSTEGDLPVKLGIAVGALLDLQAAISAVVEAFGHGADTGNQLFDARMRQAKAATTELITKFSKLSNPITIQRTKFILRHPPSGAQKGISTDIKGPNT